MKISLLVVLMTLISVTSYADGKKVKSTGECPRSMGARYKAKTKEEMAQKVVEALAKQDRQAVIRYAPCDFMVVLPESDVGGFIRPSKMIGDFILLVKSLKWGPKSEDYKTQYNLLADSSKTEQALIFRKDDSSGWYWAGYSTADAAIAKKLLKTDALEHHGGEDD